jgi:hypothetical protein
MKIIMYVWNDDKCIDFPWLQIVFDLWFTFKSKVRSWVEAGWITWHFQFFMTQYDRLKFFRVSRYFVRKLTKWFEHKMQEINRRYRCTRVTLSLYKLAHASIFLQWSELFAIKKSNVHLILFEFVQWWIISSRTKFGGLKEIMYQMWWKDSWSYQVY